MEGIVKWFNTRKGYGFIKGDDGEDYFAHFSALEKGTFIRENDRVSFENVQTERGKQAQKIVLLQKGSEISKSQGEGQEGGESQEEQLDEQQETQEDEQQQEE